MVGDALMGRYRGIKNAVPRKFRDRKSNQREQ